MNESCHINTLINTRVRYQRETSCRYIHEWVMSCTHKHTEMHTNTHKHIDKVPAGEISSLRLYDVYASCVNESCLTCE